MHFANILMSGYQVSGQGIDVNFKENNLMYHGKCHVKRKYAKDEIEKVNCFNISKNIFYRYAEPGYS